jgi:hypothetical protein
MLLKGTWVAIAGWCVLGFMPAQAQSAGERAARLRSQLAEVQAQQTELQTQLAQIDEEIKPENIEPSLAGVGSTRPEELRETRRRQLEIQRKGVQTQLDTLAVTASRLEAAIAIADSEAYRQSTIPSTNSGSNIQRASTKPRHLRKHHRLNKRGSKS